LADRLRHRVVEGIFETPKVLVMIATCPRVAARPSMSGAQHTDGEERVADSAASVRRTRFSRPCGRQLVEAPAARSASRARISDGRRALTPARSSPPRRRVAPARCGALADVRRIVPGEGGGHVRTRNAYPAPRAVRPRRVPPSGRLRDHVIWDPCWSTPVDGVSRIYPVIGHKGCYRQECVNARRLLVTYVQRFESHFRGSRRPAGHDR